MDTLNIPDGMAQSATQKKLILLLRRNIIQTVREKGKDAIRRAYPSDKPYLAFPETEEGRKYLDTFERRRSGARSSHMLEMFPLL